MFLTTYRRHSPQYTLLAWPAAHRPQYPPPAPAPVTKATLCFSPYCICDTTTICFILTGGTAHNILQHFPSAKTTTFLSTSRRHQATTFLSTYRRQMPQFPSVPIGGTGHNILAHSMAAKAATSPGTYRRHRPQYSWAPHRSPLSPCQKRPSLCNQLKKYKTAAAAYKIEKETSHCPVKKHLTIFLQGMIL